MNVCWRHGGATRIHGAVAETSGPVNVQLFCELLLICSVISKYKFWVFVEPLQMSAAMPFNTGFGLTDNAVLIAGQDENVDLEPVWTKFMPLWLALLMPEASEASLHLLAQSCIGVCV